jgi:pimeloyl-ACP methyl ester carboxylesterase
MTVATIDGVRLGFEVLGDGTGQLWVVTPGGRFSRDSDGVRRLAEQLAASGGQVLIWDRPNCGESDLSFTGPSESVLHAEALAGLLQHLDQGPAVLFGGSAGARTSLLTATLRPDLVAGLALLWISGGVFGLMSLGNHYCAASLQAAWTSGMEAVAELPEWRRSLTRNPGNRDVLLSQDRAEFIATMERWMAVYYPRDGEPVPGLTEEVAATIAVPTLVYRSGDSDCFHPRATSEALADVLPNARLIDPPWPDSEWNDGQVRMQSGTQRSPWSNWSALAPSLLGWAESAL